MALRKLGESWTIIGFLLGILVNAGTIHRERGYKKERKFEARWCFVMALLNHPSGEDLYAKEDWS